MCHPRDRRRPDSVRDGGKGRESGPGRCSLYGGRPERPCRLIILGEGPLRQELESRVSALGPEDSVSLPGWAQNPCAFMARAGFSRSRRGMRVSRVR